MLSYFILLLMLFFHFKYDFNQEPFLATYKQKSAWEKHEIGCKWMYRNDYKVCLWVHSFIWSFTIHIPVLIWGGILFYITDIKLFLENDLFITAIFSVSIFVNMIIHYITDDLKANKLKINLIKDQIIHIAQIIITLGVWYGVWIYIFFYKLIGD